MNSLNNGYFDFIYRASSTKHYTSLFMRVVMTILCLPLLLIKFVFYDSVLFLLLQFLKLLDTLISPFVYVFTVIFGFVYEFLKPIFEFHNYFFDVIVGLRKRQSNWHFLNPINYSIAILLLSIIMLKAYVIALTVAFLYRFFVIYCRNKLEFEYQYHYNSDKFDTRIRKEVLYQRFLLIGKIV